jgi:hypothetical protein
MDDSHETRLVDDILNMLNCSKLWVLTGESFKKRSQDLMLFLIIKNKLQQKYKNIYIIHYPRRVSFFPCDTLKMTDTTPIVKQGIHDAFRKCQNVLENEVSLISEDLKYLENSHAQVLEEYAQLSQKTAQLIADQAQESQSNFRLYS